MMEKVNYGNAEAMREEAEDGMEKQEKMPAPVYYVESPDDKSVMVGIDVTITRATFEGEEFIGVSWYDTSRERRMLAARVEMKEDGTFAFDRSEDDGGGHYDFRPMNLQVYNEKVKSRLIQGGDFENDEDLIKAFLETKE